MVEGRIIVVSARAANGKKLKHWYTGPDDYLTKPFSIPETLARIRSQPGKIAASFVTARDECVRNYVGDLEIDLDKRKVKIRKNEIIWLQQNIALTLLANIAGNADT